MKYHLLLAAFASLATFSAFAADPKQTTVDMTVVLREEDGSVSRHVEQATKDDPKCEKCDPITVGFAVQHALNLAFPDEQNLAAEQKWARSLLGERIKDSKAALLSAPEAALIEKLIGKAYPGPYIRQIMPIIDPNRVAPKITE